LKIPKLAQNIAFNYLGKAWAFSSVYIFIPLYISFLGIENYGLIAFYASITGLLMVADLGITNIFARQIARGSDSNLRLERATLLKSLEVVYFCIVAIILTGFFFLSDYIAGTWLNSENLSLPERAYAIKLMGIGGATQLLGSFYISGLVGLEKQITSNSIQFFWGLFKGVGGVLILWLYSPTITAFLQWQILSNIVYILMSRYYLNQQIDRKQGSVTLSVFKTNYDVTSGMVAISILASINFQIDKFMISKHLDVSLFALYSVAATLAQVPIILGNPISNALMPRLSKLHSQKLEGQLLYTYKLVTFLINTMLITVSVTIALFSKEILFLWTGKEDLADELRLVSSLLVLGSMLQAMQIMPFNLSISYGYTKATLATAVLFAVLSIVSLNFFIPHYGLIGASYSWLIINLILTIPYITLTHKALLPGYGRHFLVTAIVPFLIASIILTTARYLMPEPGWTIVIFLAAFNGITFILSALVYDHFSHGLLKKEIKNLFA
jgi:O-antigen/teichoic acid export membrane protein